MSNQGNQGYSGNQQYVFQGQRPDIENRLFVCLLGFNVRAAIFQLYSDDEHETMMK